jgi:putative ATP-dependent endonuclease of OLD family
MLAAYRYHFLTRSKPATHLAALAHIASNDLKAKMPPILAEVLTHVAKSVRRD